MVSFKVKDQTYRQSRQERPNEPWTIDDVNLEKYPDLIVDKRGDKLCHGPTKSDGVVVMSKVQATIGGQATSAVVDVLETIQDICNRNGTKMDVIFVHCDCEFTIHFWAVAPKGPMTYVFSNLHTSPLQTLTPRKLRVFHKSEDPR